MFSEVDRWPLMDLVSYQPDRQGCISLRGKEEKTPTKWPMTVIAVRMVKTSNLGAQGPALDINEPLKLTKFAQIVVIGLSSGQLVQSSVVQRPPSVPPGYWTNQTEIIRTLWIMQKKKGGTFEVIWHSILFPCMFPCMYTLTTSMIWSSVRPSSTTMGAESFWTGLSSRL